MLFKLLDVVEVPDLQFADSQALLVWNDRPYLIPVLNLSIKGIAVSIRKVAPHLPEIVINLQLLSSEMEGYLLFFLDFYIFYNFLLLGLFLILLVKSATIILLLLLLHTARVLLDSSLDLFDINFNLRALLRLHTILDHIEPQVGS